jgi:hypothetical protein
MVKKKKKSISLWPVVDEIDETIEKLAAAKKKASAADKRILNLRIKSIRGLRKIATARCGGLDLYRPSKM